MERLTIDEVIKHCKRHTDEVEEHNSKTLLENGDMDYPAMKRYWEHRQVAEWLEQLKEYRDAEEQGLLLWLDSKDELIEVLATKLLYSEFGRCYMCRNSAKNITLDGVNNGCDGMCINKEDTVNDFLKKIVSEIEYKKLKAEQSLAKMKIN